MVEKNNNKYKKSLQLRNKDPKKKQTGTRHKDGQKFKDGKSAKGKPKVAKKNLKCFNRGGYVTCVDTSKAKNYHKKSNGDSRKRQGGKKNRY